MVHYSELVGTKVWCSDGGTSQLVYLNGLLGSIYRHPMQLGLHIAWEA